MPESTEPITHLTHDDKEIILVGTAHISQDSVDTVRQVIETEQPDTVCVELDSQRHQALKDQNRWESLNIIQVIRKGQVPFLMANLALASFQKRMGLQTGVKPGAKGLGRGRLRSLPVPSKTWLSMLARSAARAFASASGSAGAAAGLPAKRAGSSPKPATPVVWVTFSLPIAR